MPLGSGPFIFDTAEWFSFKVSVIARGMPPPRSLVFLPNGDMLITRPYPFDFGFNAVDKKVHPHGLQATVLFLLGIDHTKMTYDYSGRKIRLTDTSGELIHDIIA